MTYKYDPENDVLTVTLDTGGEIDLHYGHKTPYISDANHGAILHELEPHQDACLNYFVIYKGEFYNLEQFFNKFYDTWESEKEESEQESKEWAEHCRIESCMSKFI